MQKPLNKILKSIAAIFVAMLFFTCSDTYERVGEEAKKTIFPGSIAKNFVLSYTEAKQVMTADTLETSKTLAVLAGPLSENYTNLTFPYRTFPNGLEVELFDDQNKKSTITADYGIMYSATNLIDLQGNVVIKSHDGKKLETPQLYLDRGNEWMFTHEKFKYTNPEDGTIMDGVGMDFSKDQNFLFAHKTYGLMLIPQEKLEEND